MKITVLGLWHLGCVTAACAGKFNSVVGLDFDEKTISELEQGRAPIFEPGLDDLLKSGLQTGRLVFTTDVAAACGRTDLLWVTYDTPVDESDRSDSDFVLNQLRRCLPHLPTTALVLLSSQLPVGTCRQLEAECGSTGLRFAYSPENLRLGNSLETFLHPERIVVGARDEKTRAQLKDLLAPFSTTIVWMRPESAEMTKNAINSFLALSVAFSNEIARLCERTGADALEVEEGLKSDQRIGRRAYLSPGGAFAGGTLARDVVALSRLAATTGEQVAVIPAIKQSNDLHRSWSYQKLSDYFGDLNGRQIAILGLSYKPKTDTLRRSVAIELAVRLQRKGATVRGFDPSIRRLPPNMTCLSLELDAAGATRGADAVVIGCGCEEFRALDWPVLLDGMRGRLIVDDNGFVRKQIAKCSDVIYRCVGKPDETAQ